MNRAETSRQSFKADIVLVAVTLIAALGWIFSFHSLQGLPPLLFIGIRFLAGGLILGAFDLNGVASVRSTPGFMKRCVHTGLVLSVAMMCWIMGLQLTTAMSAGAFISSLGVIIAPIMGGVLFRARIARSTWVAALVATGGMACLALRSGMTVHGADLFFLASALAFSIQFNLNSRFAGKIPVMPLAAIQISVVGLVSLAASSGLETWPHQVSGATWLWVGISILIGTCLRFYLQVSAQGRTPLSHAAFIMTLEPVWTALLAMIWLGERMRPLQLLGSALILGALVISRWRSLPG
ncbi:MAG: DMT family transporter [Propionivibrio sp.]